jgi:hypothetical protein
MTIETGVILATLTEPPYHQSPSILIQYLMESPVLQFAQFSFVWKSFLFIITIIRSLSMTLNDDLGWMEEYGKDYDYFQAIVEDLYSKHKNEFVAVKNLKVYHDANPLGLQE